MQSARVLTKLRCVLSALTLFACSGATAEDGSLVGTFVETRSHYASGETRVSYSLRVPGEDDERALVFAAAPDLMPQSRIRVWGSENENAITVDRFEVMSDAPLRPGISREGIIGADPIPPTSMVMVLVDLGSGVDITVEEMNAELFADDPSSLKNYYLENSYGMHTLTGQVMPTVYSYTMPEGECDSRGLAETLKPEVDADAGTSFDLYLWYFSEIDTCGWSGQSAGEDTFYNGSSGCVVLAQEPGHSFGLSHSSSLECANGDTVVSFLDDPNLCTHDEYGNRYDTMGTGCRHFSAYHKVYRSYLQQCNVVNVPSSGTFTLLPIESPCNGTQVLQVPMPKTRILSSAGGGSGERYTELTSYLVELRAPIGFDESMEPSVLINAAPEFRFFEQGYRNNRGEHIWLLDMAPTVTSGRFGGNGEAHALGLGQTFTDPAGGVSITTQALSATSATIQVEIVGGSGSPTCLGGEVVTAPGPSTCDAGGAAGMPGAAGGAGMGGASMGGATSQAGSGAAGANAGLGGMSASAGTGGMMGVAGAPLAGSGAAMGGAPGGGGAPGTAGGDPIAGTGPVASSTDEPTTLEGGCGCRVPRTSTRPSALGLSLLAGVVFAAARRRRLRDALRSS